MTTIQFRRSRIAPIAALAATLFMAGCATTTPLPDGAAEVRAKLTALQSDPALAGGAPVAIKDAEIAVRRAEEASAGSDHARHLVYIADRKVDTARARAESRLAEDQREILRAEQESARLVARTREADRARSDAASARSEAYSARAEAETQRQAAEQARSAAERARSDADLARLETSDAQQQAEELRQQLTELNARQTDRGMVVTLGDVLFATGSANLKAGPAGGLGKLATFLNKYPERTVMIEGHTDSIGSDENNQRLSQRRAESVRNFLLAQGVNSQRIRSLGKGESTPVSSNDSATGRQQNRRVEVIIENTPENMPAQ